MMHTILNDMPQIEMEPELGGGFDVAVTFSRFSHASQLLRTTVTNRRPQESHIRQRKISHV
jgi:hypothetical protein